MKEYKFNITYVAVQKNTHLKAMVCSHVVQFHITRPEIVHEITEATKQNSSRNFQQNNSVIIHDGGWSPQENVLLAAHETVP
jgi:hypothetical protein